MASRGVSWGHCREFFCRWGVAMPHLNHWGLAKTLVPVGLCSDSREPLGPCSGARALGFCSEYHIFYSMSKQPLMIRDPEVPRLCPQLVPPACALSLWSPWSPADLPQLVLPAGDPPLSSADHVANPSASPMGVSISLLGVTLLRCHLLFRFVMLFSAATCPLFSLPVVLRCCDEKK